MRPALPLPKLLLPLDLFSLNLMPSLCRAADKTGANKAIGMIKRDNKVAEGDAQAHQIASAKRFQELVMSHGHECITTAKNNAANGHQVMANVMLTLEMMHIQRACAEEKINYLSDELFEEVADLYSEVALLEDALRSHNVMKMAVYGILNKQKSKASSMSFSQYGK